MKTRMSVPRALLGDRVLLASLARGGEIYRASTREVGVNETRIDS
jgi:hypothetical protein